MEKACPLGGWFRLGLRSDWLRLMKGFGPCTGSFTRSPQSVDVTGPLVEVQACGGRGTGQGLASNREGEAGQKTDRALLNTRDEGNESSLLFSRDQRCILGDAGGDGALMGYMEGDTGGASCLIALLFSLDHLCTFGEAGGDGALIR